MNKGVGHTAFLVGLLATIGAVFGTAVADSNTRRPGGRYYQAQRGISLSSDASDSGVHTDATFADASDSGTHNDAAPADGGVLPIVLSNESYYHDMRLWVHSHSTLHAQEADTTTIQLASSDADGDPIGTIYDPSQYAHTVQSLTTARTPILRTASSKPYIEFTGVGASSTDRLTVMGSPLAFNHIPTSLLGTVMLRVRMTEADGQGVILADNNAGTSANSGIYIARTSSNRIQVIVTANNLVKCNHTTSASADLLAADGFVWVVWRGNGAGANAIEINVGAVEERFTCTTAGHAGNPPTLAMTFGGSVGGSTADSYDMSDALIFGTRRTDDEIAAIQADVDALTRTSDSMLITRTATQGCYNFLRLWFDHTNAATVFEDSAATDPAESGDVADVVRDPRDLGNLLGRGMTSTAANGPTWVTTDGLNWPGTSAQTSNWQQSTVRGGTKTTLTRIRNLDTQLGSHFLVPTIYTVMTGADYASNPGGAAYFTVHPAGSTGRILTSLVSETGFNWIEIRRNFSTWTGSVDGTNTTTESDSTEWNPYQRGRSANFSALLNNDWRAWADIRQEYEFNVILTDAEIANVEAGCP